MVQGGEAGLDNLEVIAEEEGIVTGGIIQSRGQAGEGLGLGVTEGLEDSVMTRSMPGPDPIPASARPRTDPRRFIANALRVASRHVTHSRRVHPHDARTRHGTCGP